MICKVALTHDFIKVLDFGLAKCATCGDALDLSVDGMRPVTSRSGRLKRRRAGGSGTCGALTMRHVLIAAILALVIVASTGAQSDISKLGPQVGGQAIDFDLSDQFARRQTLATVAGPKGTMLVFFRSADW
jgi:hypothetical protein